MLASFPARLILRREGQPAGQSPDPQQLPNRLEVCVMRIWPPELEGYELTSRAIWVQAGEVGYFKA